MLATSFTSLAACSFSWQGKNGGGGEIRTLGWVLANDGFQDRCIRPLCHPSAEVAYIKPFAKRVNTYELKFMKKGTFFELNKVYTTY